jgi:EmrB/QacA subfamily drug resistance transporter
MEKNPTEKSRPALTIIAIAIAIFMTNLDTSIVNIALPEFTKIFHADTGEVSRIVLVYLLAMVSLLLVFGKVSDLKGSERIFTTGYVVFTLASGLCAFAPSLNLLIVFRFIQGVGGAMLLATWGAVAMKYLPAGMRGRAFGIVTVFGGIGMAIGAPVGGLLIHYLSWEWIFLINLPVGIAAIILIRFALNKKNVPAVGNDRFDFAGAAFSFAGILCLFLVLNTGADYGWLSWKSILLFIIAAGCLSLFYFREKRCISPLLNFRMLKNKHVLSGYTSTVIVVMILMGFNFLFPFYFDFVRHLDPEKTGFLLMTFPVVSILISPVSGYFCDKRSSRMVSMVALFFLIASSFLFATFGMMTSYYLVIASFLLFGVGLALFFTANTALVMSHATPGAEGMFTALLSAVTYLGAAFGINFFELIFSLGFPVTGRKLIPGNLPPEMLTTGFLHASVFGIILAIFGLMAVLIYREKSKQFLSS